MASAVRNLICFWRQSGLGVGTKIHMVNSHLIPMLATLKDGEGLEIWSEQALESSHGVFKIIYNRFKGLPEGLKEAQKEYNYLRF